MLLVQVRLNLRGQLPLSEVQVGVVVVLQVGGGVSQLHPHFFKAVIASDGEANMLSWEEIEWTI